MPILTHHIPDNRFSGQSVQKLKNLHARQKEIVRLSATGLKNVEVSKILDCTPQNVSDVINSEVGEAEIARISGSRDSVAEDFTLRIKKLALKALDILDTQLSGYDVKPNLEKVMEDVDEGFEVVPVSASLRKDVALGLVKETTKITGREDLNNALITRDELIAIRDAAVGAGAIEEAKYEELA